MAPLPFSLDGGTGPRARLGLLVLATDQVIEHEWRLILAGLPGVALYESRLWNDARITPLTLRAMEPLIAPATALLLPDEPLDVIAFGCTSASMVLGEARIAELIRSVRPAIRTTTPVTAALAALAALGARRIALLTPYREDVNEGIRRWFEGRGIEVAARASFEEEDDHKVARISEASIQDAVLTLARETTVDAVFVSCTSLRVAAIARTTEAMVGCPVLSSNHAMAWHTLRLAGIDDVLPAWGSLFERPLPPASTS
jgi:maleate isomerase